MSNTDPDRRNDPNLDADLGRLADDAPGDPTPARIGGAPAPNAAETPDSLPEGEASRKDVGGSGAPRTSVEGVDEDAARRDAVRDATSRGR